jgi:alkylglycerol monooxygenase
MNLNPIGIAVPFFLILIGIEYFVLKRQKREVRLNDAVTDISCGVGDQMLSVFLKSLALFPYAYVVEHGALMEMSTSNPWVWVFGVFAVDLFYYLYHRVCHRVNLGWATHSVHHQSEAYNLSVALRQPWFSIVYSWVFYIPLAVIGLPLEVYVTTFAFNLLYQFWIHTETIDKMGWFEYLFNTPSHHRVHHGTNPKYIDKNYAGIFIIWDRMFGTFELEEETPLYGTLKPLNSWNPFWANVSPWVSLAQRTAQYSSFTDKVKVWFAPPEWTPDGPFDTEAAFNGPDRGYDRDEARGWHGYIAVNLTIAAVIIGAVLTFENQVSMLVKVGAAIVMFWTVIGWGQMFEGHRLAWRLEIGRIVLVLGLTTALFLN